jgi:NADH-quinone oxidoreductase subunit L
MAQYILIPLFPLAAFIILGLFGWRIRGKAHWVAIPAVFLSFVFSVIAFLEVSNGNLVYADLYSWIGSGDFRVSIGLQIDELTAVMLLLVTVVSGLVNLYSVGYLHGDRGYARFFAYVALFTFSMIMLVLANNFLQLYVFWEAVGLCSYLLIAHWYERKSACDAATKAFIVNRVGDFGFGLGVLLIFVTFGSLDYLTVFTQAPLHQGETINLMAWAGGNWEVNVLTLVALLLFAGAVGKSAQIPLHVWLPDAMEGPTPISALIHAATMVTAGIFMLARTHPIFDLSPLAMNVVLVVGGVTGIFAAFIALTQNDIKRIVAYSTVSQLGAMTMACGLGAYAAGIFHLLTHGAFKALLFLCAGSVIHALSGEQDLRRMGGLRSFMPVTYWTFVIGGTALAGIFPLAGFFSKDAILLQSFEAGGLGRVFGGIALIMTVLTAFYSFRLIFRVFHGQSKSPVRHPHESPWVMTVPLLVLAVLSFITGWLPIPQFLSGVLGSPAAAVEAHGGVNTEETYLGIVSMLAGLGGILLAYLFYVRFPGIPEKLAHGILYRLSFNKGYVDELYDRFFVRPTVNMANALWKYMDVEIIDGAVNGVADLTRDWGTALRRIQTGQIQHYALYMALGAFVMITVYLLL